MPGRDWLDRLPGILSDEPLSRHSQFGVGGPSKALTTAVFNAASRVVLAASEDGTVCSYRCVLCGGLEVPLRLARGRLDPADEKFPERVILMPDSGKLPFIGREDLLAELRAWLAHETDISVHALTAAANQMRFKPGFGDPKPSRLEYRRGSDLKQ